MEKKKNTQSNKDFGSSRERASRTRRIDPPLYYGEDGSTFKILKYKKNPIFHRYERVSSCNEDRHFNERLGNLRKIYNEAIRSRGLWPGPKVIALEGEWTDNLKELLRSGNSVVTRSISYRLAESEENAYSAEERQK